MFKIRSTEKALNSDKKLLVESKVILYKSDFIFLFNRKIKKVNKLNRNNKRIYIVTFYKSINNNKNIYKLNYYL